MKTIIKKGEESTCGYCKCVFSYEQEDIIERHFREACFFYGVEKNVTCPNCHRELHIEDVYQ